jgi:hypothetical protein
MLDMLVLNVISDHMVYASAPASFSDNFLYEIKHENLSHAVYIQIGNNMNE